MASRSPEDHEHWMFKAIELAKIASLVEEVPVGAVIIMDGKVVGEGWNRSMIDTDPSAHAEIIALRSAAANLNNHRLPGARLYVTVEPCAMCAGAIIQARIQTVVFGAFDPKSGAAGSVFNVLNEPALNHQCEVVGGILEKDCAELLQTFFRSRRRRH